MRKVMPWILIAVLIVASLTGCGKAPSDKPNSQE